MIRISRSKRSGVIWESSWKSAQGEIPLHPGYKVEFNFSALTSLLSLISWSTLVRILGKSLIVFSAVTLILTLSPLLAVELKQQTRRISQKISGPSQIINEKKEIESLPPAEKRFQLVIPKIGANSPVIANIDPTNKNEYSAALKQGIAHARGSGLPGEKGQNWTIYLFAHSTDAPYNISRFNAVFYLLKDLNSGDEIIIWFWGKRFVYQVEKKEILLPNNTDYFKPQTQEEILILQTCWPPGTTTKQLIVKAKFLY